MKSPTYRRRSFQNSRDLVFHGNRLLLNIDTGAMGTAFVELQDADASPLAGKPIRIRIQMKRAKLYAFQFRQE